MKNYQRIGLFLLFLACGLLVFIVFSHYFPIFKGRTDIIGRIVVAVAFLIASLLARRSERFRKYWLILFAFFAALTAISIDRYVSISKLILPALNVNSNSPAGWAIEKLESSLLGIVVVLALNRLAGQGVDSLYIRRGKLGLGLTVGLFAFIVMIATVIPVAETYFKGENLTWARHPDLGAVGVDLCACKCQQRRTAPARFVHREDGTVFGKVRHQPGYHHSVCLNACFHQLLGKQHHISRPTSPAGFAGVVLAHAKNEQHLGFHPVPCRNGYSDCCRDFLRVVDVNLK